jgi:hypothetical protein
VNLLTYNAKLVFWQKLESCIFPVVIGALTLAVLYSSGDKPVGSKMLFEVISPFVLGLLVIDILPREMKWKTAEIVLVKPVSMAKILYLRYVLLLGYGITILFIAASFFTFTDFFSMRSFLASIPVIMVVTSLSMFLSLVFGQNIAAFGIIFVLLIEGSAGPKFLPLFLFLETFSPDYHYFLANRGIFVIISIALWLMGLYILKNPEKIMR